MASNAYDELMQAWFSKNTYNRRKVETDIRGIAEILERTSNVSWSRIPRIYSVLRIIDQLQAIDCFLTEGVSDVGFPFTSKSLPSSLRDHATRSAFLSAQELVFNTRAQNLEREDSGHSHFRDRSDVPFKKVEELGKGAYGFVDRVVSTISHREYARKLIPRGKNFRKDKGVLLNFERELSNLKRISTHKHVVQLVASYTDPRYVGILTSPVADCNLHEYLSQQLDTGKRSFLRGFFGCLASAICFLHDSKIRHKDIKPQNILVKGECIYLTDFGLSLDWSERSHSVTTGPSVATPRYAAPEVASHSPRNSSADIWSLGCVYLEMWTVVRGETKQSMELHLAEKGSQSTQYCMNSVGVSTWIEAVIRAPGSVADNAPVDWIKNMLQREGSERWTAHQLEEQLQIHDEDDTTPFAYTGRCCSHDEDTEGSVYSTCDEDVGDDNEARETTLPELHSEKKDLTHTRLTISGPSWDLPAALKVSHLEPRLRPLPIFAQRQTTSPVPLVVDTGFRATTEQSNTIVVETYETQNQGINLMLDARDDLTAKPRDAGPALSSDFVPVADDHDGNSDNNSDKLSKDACYTSDISTSETFIFEEPSEAKLAGSRRQRSGRFPPQPYAEDETVSLARETVGAICPEDDVLQSPSSWAPKEHGPIVSPSRQEDGHAKQQPKGDWDKEWKDNRTAPNTESSQRDAQKQKVRVEIDGDGTKVRPAKGERKRAHEDEPKSNTATTTTATATTDTVRRTADERNFTPPRSRTTREKKKTSNWSACSTTGDGDRNIGAKNLANKQWVFFSSGSRHKDSCKLCSGYQTGSIRLRCGQQICEQCLKSKIDLAIRYPQFMPPVCGNVEIVLNSSQLLSYLDQDLTAEYIRKYRTYKSFYPDFCQPSKENVLVCPTETCRINIIPSKVRVDRPSGKKFVRCPQCIVPVCLTCGIEFHGGSHCSGFATRPPRWEMCWQICPKCLLPWSKCPCKVFNEGLHDTEDDQDVFPIMVEERGYDPNWSRETKETPTHPEPSQYHPLNRHNDHHQAPSRQYHPQQGCSNASYGPAYYMPYDWKMNPFMSANTYEESQRSSYTNQWNNRPTTPQVQYQPVAPPLTAPYTGYYGASLRQPSPLPQRHAKAHPPRHQSNHTNNIRRDSRLNHDNGQAEATHCGWANDEYQSDRAQEPRHSLRKQRSHRRTTNSAIYGEASCMSAADSRMSAVAVVNRERESAQAGLSYDDALNSPERIIEWLHHVRVDEEATQESNWTDEGSCNGDGGYTDSSETFIESDDDYWDIAEA